MSAKMKRVESAGMPIPLDVKEPEPGPSLRTVPEKPTLEMLAAGGRAGRVPVETVWDIWRAMLKAVPR